MVEQEWIELGKRAVACKDWRWMPGMLVRKGDWSRRIDDDWVSPAVCGAVPDFRDDATKGCLLALVRKAWDDPFALVDYDRKHWGIFVEARDTVWVCTAKTEAAALVAALKEAAND